MKTRYQLQAKGDRNELIIYGDIGQSWDAEESNDAATVVEKISGLSGDIDVRINSYGGSVADGLAIHNALKRHPGRVFTHIDGIAYSIASLIAMAGHEISIAGNALLMIHAPWGGAIGNAVEMREMADILDKHAEAMVSSYLRDGGPDAETIRAWLTDGQDHYFTAGEAIEQGLADVTADNNDLMDIAAQLRNDLRQFHIPAALGRITPQESATMADNKPTLGAPEAPEDITLQHSKTVEAAKAAGAVSEAKRRRQIDEVFAGFHDGDPLNVVTAVYNQCIDDTQCGELDARRKLLACLKSRSADPVVASEQYGMSYGTKAPPNASVYLGGAVAGLDQADKVSGGIELALMVKAGYEKDEKRVREARASGLFGMSLLELGAESMRAHGIDVRSGADKMAMAYRILASHTSSDFPNVLANIASKAAMVGYNEAPETWQQWCKVGNLTDFKQAKRVTTTAFPDLDQIPESGEYKFASISDVGEPIQLATFGKKFRISRQALINDDLNAFTDIPRKMGRAAARTPGNLAYAVLTANAALSQDSTELFHANHGNLVASGSGAAPSVATLDDGFTAMALQTDPDANVVSMNLEPRFLLVPRALRTTARVVVGSEKDPTYDATNPGTPINPFYNSVTVVSDARLDSASVTGWYLAADPNQADTIEIAFLSGNQAPVVDQMEMTSPDGRDFYVRLDCAAAALSYQGLYFNFGA